MRKEYDLTDSKPNPYAKRLGARGREVLVDQFLRSENVVRLDQDIAEAFAVAVGNCGRQRQSPQGISYVEPGVSTPGDRPGQEARRRG